ncbi:FadR/GntR family transcriptional regulator [Pseudonocardia alaniniphila]|uniref:GntR family transcriptional regulator n=1 Tax=Pseudonocardia alaniniphila TaxID=75291 RepID=A0ABS9TST0_9PSEU|nr:GntR family transcriptional regulator [Pseudonocardia alaniniphila]MCH6171428.1 GntR family transcriptional regulator [Pseudonocardia alaniniphila]
MESHEDDHQLLVTPAATADTFDRTTARRAPMMIVDQVRALMRAGLLVAGDRLPSERELGDRFGVSRVTVREALRTLETHGLVTIRVGIHGGAYITAPTGVRVIESIADVLALSVNEAADVVEARQAFELGILPVVCDRADQNDIQDLFAICDRSEAVHSTNGDLGSLSAEFHIRVARASHNAAIELLALSFYSPLLMMSKQAGGPPETGEFRSFVSAVAEKNVRGAATIMNRLLAHGGV